MDPDALDAMRHHELFRHSKARELRMNKVKTRYIGNWQCCTSGRVFRVYEKEYTELGCFEYWLKHKGKVERVRYDFNQLLKAYKRVDNLKGKKDEQE